MNDFVSRAGGQLFVQIKSDFDGLWLMKPRGETVEFITPYTTLNDEAVSVFITQRDNGYVVSDGGRIGEVMEEQEVDFDEYKSFHHPELVEKFGVRMTKGPSRKQTFYYKIASQIDKLTSCIYDMAHFQHAVMDAIFMETMFAVQNTQVMKFSRKVRDLLKWMVDSSAEVREQYEIYVDERSKLLQFTTGIRKRGTEERWLGMSICRTNLQNYRRSVLRAEFGFNHLEPDPLLKLASISDVLPPHLVENDNAIMLGMAMDAWRRKKMVANYSLPELQGFSSPKQLFGKTVA